MVSCFLIVYWVNCHLDWFWSNWRGKNGKSRLADSVLVVICCYFGSLLGLDSLVIDSKDNWNSDEVITLWIASIWSKKVYLVWIDYAFFFDGLDDVKIVDVKGILVWKYRVIY